MNDKQARDAAQQIMANNSPGTEIFLTSEGMILNNPHYSTQNGWHSDGYHAVVQPNGQVVVHKFHNPQDPNAGGR